jgi:fluoride exporter
MPDPASLNRPISDRWRGRFAPIAAVAAGGLLGSAGRSVVSSLVPSAPGAFPTGTLIVNLTGSLLLGFYLARRQNAVTTRWSLQFWAIGVLGSFTTFSTFSLETFRLIDGGATPTAAVYVLASMIGGLIAALVGDRVGSRFP